MTVLSSTQKVRLHQLRENWRPCPGHHVKHAPQPNGHRPLSTITAGSTPPNTQQWNSHWKPNDASVDKLPAKATKRSQGQVIDRESSLRKPATPSQTGRTVASRQRIFANGHSVADDPFPLQGKNKEPDCVRTSPCCWHRAGIELRRGARHHHSMPYSAYR